MMIIPLKGGRLLKKEEKHPPKRGKCKKLHIKIRGFKL